ncbi:uncharacterized protein PF3D7_1120600 isoform X2 [Prorops nasuta]|uniref:uncharacterized protein PF3D7_1120600 isoform X2 n=1 Tax=Prorops nasuta TaxID=863751 RepID=UPI0034CE6E25
MLDRLQAGKHYYFLLLVDLRFKMIRKPLRTYSRKDVIDYKKKSTNANVFNNVNEKYTNIFIDGDMVEVNENDGINSDPLETTFDRIAKDTKIPSPYKKNESNSTESYADSSSSLDNKSQEDMVFSPLPEYPICKRQQRNQNKRLIKKQGRRKIDDISFITAKYKVKKNNLKPVANKKKSKKQPFDSVNMSKKYISESISSSIKEDTNVKTLDTKKPQLRDEVNFQENAIARKLEWNVKQCVVNLTRLEQSVLSKKNLNKEKNLKCSTPSSKFRMSTLQICLSPISSKEKISNTDVNQLLSITAATNRSELLFNESKSYMELEELDSLNTIDNKQECLTKSNSRDNFAVSPVIKSLNNSSVSKDFMELNISDNKSTSSKVIDVHTNSKIFNAGPDTILKEKQDPIIEMNNRKRIFTHMVELSNIEESSDHLKVDQQFCSVETKELKDNCSNMSVENAIINKPTEKQVFLTPGKCWARSLSILNNIHGGVNMENLSSGKGKNWRKSVLNIIEMQKQGNIQDCIGANTSNSITNLGTNDITVNHIPESNLASDNFNRMSKRISIRVVPIRKSVKCIEDEQFLKAYGIKQRRTHNSIFLSKARKTRVHSISEQNEKGFGECENISEASAKQVVLNCCSQKDYLKFSECFPNQYLNNCKKIGEGVYGEVFLYETRSNKSVVKIIPIEGSELVNEEPQKKFHEILSEIIITKELHNLRLKQEYKTDSFVEVKNIKCIYGKYPKKLIDLWKRYDEEKASDNDCPSMFNEKQLYIVFELSHAGQDLEAFIFNSANEAYAILIQIVYAMAVAEKSLEFEHRDLHWGNVLISRTKDLFVSFKIAGREIKVCTHGVKASIIDFTLSRMIYQGCCIYNDLATDPTLFTAQGEYQFEIYRLMRDKIRNKWQTFEPYTNILWLHYTLDKMITAVRYKKINTKIHKETIQSLKELKSVILNYDSAFDFINRCDRIRDFNVQ